MKRTGSSGSCVGPAVMRIVSPSRSLECCELVPLLTRGAACAVRFATISAIRSGSASLPGPVVPHASRPSSGSIMVWPRCLKIARFSWVAGCAHMLLFMAGASTTGPVNARYVVVRKSFANPWARRAMRSAVAGAITRMSFSCATAICSTALERVSSELAPENRPVITLRPVRAAKVSGVMKCCAASVRTT